ncbi:hypothetical protein HJC23_005222 [Cyclotella cryptica]|uniref:Uncharacterized protein n=1 Tax=Cyclotella cryptica TaxID=29204 RepID=A0ABD3P3T3_9STRA
MLGTSSPESTDCSNELTKSSSSSIAIVLISLTSLLSVSVSFFKEKFFEGDYLTFRAPFPSRERTVKIQNGSIQSKVMIGESSQRAMVHYSTIPILYNSVRQPTKYYSRLPRIVINRAGSGIPLLIPETSTFHPSTHGPVTVDGGDSP